MRSPLLDFPHDNPRQKEVDIGSIMGKLARSDDGCVLCDYCLACPLKRWACLEELCDKDLPRGEWIKVVRRLRRCPIWKVLCDKDGKVETLE